MSIKKKDLIDVISQSGGISQAKAAEVWTALRDTLAAAAHNGEPVCLFDMAKLSVTTYKAWTARNLHTGEPVAVPARKRFKVKTLWPAKEILDAA